jgi:hypothetical protein
LIDEPALTLLLPAPTEETCPLKRLLELGADPNLRSNRITPLQIAVYARDVEGVSALLRAGADPNDTGNSAGTIWEDGSYMSLFNRLHGASVLYICKNTEAFDYLLEGRSENVKKIERALLQCGVRSFLASSFKPSTDIPLVATSGAFQSLSSE